MAELGLKPMLLWAQRNDTVFLTVSLNDLTNEKFSLEDDLFTFAGQSGRDGPLYAVEVPLFKEVIPQESKHRKTARGLFFVIKKKDSGPYWPRLQKASGKMNYIRTDFNRWKDEDESESDTEDYGGGNDSLNAMMQQMGGAGMGGGMGGFGAGGPPNLDDLQDEDDDSDDEALPDLEDQV